MCILVQLKVLRMLDHKFHLIHNMIGVTLDCYWGFFLLFLPYTGSFHWQESGDSGAVIRPEHMGKTEACPRVGLGGPRTSIQAGTARDWNSKKPQQGLGSHDWIGRGSRDNHDWTYSLCIQTISFEEVARKQDPDNKQTRKPPSEILHRRLK